MDPEGNQDSKPEPLSNEETQAFRHYGRLPRRRNLRRRNLLEHQTRKYFDSGDFALSAAHRMADNGAIQTGASHPVPGGISHPFSPVPKASNVSNDANEGVHTKGKHPSPKVVQTHLSHEIDNTDIKVGDAVRENTVDG
ncbi:hypothetical protein FE257_004884 [Aspergillus nanangensis]|uniref:mRNA stability protein n=1 Tax=Aspergillus nanangensis TaxID=2582783 RepID=A0AAD4GP31_ASPNN|nr:hypothetical protein FE257_004884 [Aspergillus nanangensis]